MNPAATRGASAKIVFHTCPRVSRTLSLPAMKRERKPSPAKEREEWPEGKERKPSLR